MARLSAIERFQRNIQITPGCWIWRASVNCAHGYGNFYLDGQRTTAHRVSHRLYIGEIPNGLWVLHKCDNRVCVNPDHLFLGTVADNNRDKGEKGRAFKMLGEDNKLALLNNEKVLAIRADKRINRVIAAEYGVTTTTISSVRNRRSWKHV